MAITLSSASLPVFQTALTNLLHCLEKAEASATARKFWLSTRWAMPPHGRDAYASVPPPAAPVVQRLQERFRRWSTVADDALV
ncbi:MAG: hypothetical protein A3G82_09490 [Burkholderiales bacterium RIFCSPLOWO2_12_FULL_67_210]|nr:MAG: hypothetical protein A3G82_09490 [Burkholderiales bacterium RIFCSPLOWO2_12_FULL_67_210]